MCDIDTFLYKKILFYGSNLLLLPPYRNKSFIFAIFWISKTSKQSLVIHFLHYHVFNLLLLGKLLFLCRRYNIHKQDEMLHDTTIFMNNLRTSITLHFKFWLPFLNIFYNLYFALSVSVTQYLDKGVSFVVIFLKAASIFPLCLYLDKLKTYLNNLK